MAIILNTDIGTSKESIEFYKRYKEAFGEIISVEMISVPKNTDFKLTLINTEGEELLFDGGLTAGYLGQGCRATQKVLALAGFPIDDEFIETHTSFKLTR
ncbi:hypothetical protein LGL08_22140 [Clostridium estertheticum]|uniref:hypothetical protein n=1 Tax=Clostridium estertheticum TaxID=238834 RepID=UPI001CF0F6BA|nr:hypothetical protein [Clostridium estertheticum]MCB2309263.1 hypothetical protein [Clostridium estertheticum]MCB2346796.1 hypothetical protein [Clostridium estertheticum]MCB2352226.1 hypothetical protein [Clostridium estertheticum]WAG48535.1 hypothetical protein LL127_23660 [Clostridium estertheticum]